MKIVILGSGRGSNARALLQAKKDGKLANTEIAGIIADVESAPILQLGKEFGVHAEFISAAPFKTKLDDDGQKRYIERIKALNPDLIVLAGFMRVIKKPFIDAFNGKLINLHPSLLPSFPGLDGIGQAFRFGVKITGCTVHWVTADLDAGPIIDQSPIRILPEDSVETLAQKIHAAEHELLCKVVAQLSQQNG